MANYDIILGIPWLKRYNLIINWTIRVLRFTRKEITRNRQAAEIINRRAPIYRQKTMVDKRPDLLVVEATGASISKDKDGF